MFKALPAVNLEIVLGALLVLAALLAVVAVTLFRLRKKFMRLFCLPALARRGAGKNCKPKFSEDRVHEI